MVNLFNNKVTVSSKKSEFYWLFSWREFTKWDYG